MAEEKPNPPRNPDYSTPGFEPEAQSDETLSNEFTDSKEAVDKIEEVGGLQVEKMRESDELQERRRQAKRQALHELDDTGDGGDGETLLEEDDDEGGLMDLLREANLSTRHLKFCCGGVLGLLLLIGLFFGGKAVWTYWQNRPEETPQEEPVNNNEPQQEPSSSLDPSLMSGIRVGGAQITEDDATSTGQNLGEQKYDDVFTQQIADFAEIYSGLQTDVNELLSKSSSRYDALKDFEDRLNYLKYVGEQNEKALQADSDNLVAKFDAVQSAKDEKETQFFEKLKDLDAPATSAALDAFIVQAEDVVQLRAEFNARQKLLSYYEQALEALDLKIKDISLNEEALVKGVQVVQIEGSDLNLIIDEDSL